MPQTVHQKYKPINERILSIFDLIIENYPENAKVLRSAKSKFNFFIKLNPVMPTKKIIDVLHPYQSAIISCDLAELRNVSMQIEILQDVVGEWENDMDDAELLPYVEKMRDIYIACCNTMPKRLLNSSA